MIMKIYNFQATDPDPYRGGVANIPNSEMDGVEIEFMPCWEIQSLLI